MERSPHNLQFLTGGGEMSELIRQKDWSATSLGPISGWPQSLRTTLSIMLHSGFPMFLFWGAELTCFYNDAFRPSLGNDGKHPSILGERGQLAWAEIWHIVGSMIEGVLAGGPPVWMEDMLTPMYRNGRIENVYWTFSYSAVHDESGKIVGVFVTCAETTDKVRLVEELTDNKDRLEFAVDATELGTWGLDLKTNDIIVNNRVKSWFGLDKNDSITLAQAANIIAERDRERVLNAIAASTAPGSNVSYDIEYTIVNPHTKQERLVLARGKALFNEEHIAYSFSGTLQDITERSFIRRQAEKAEAEFRNIVFQMPIGITIFRGPQFMVEMANETYLQIIDRKEADFVGRPLFEGLPEVKEYVEGLLNNVFTTGEPYYGYEFPVTIHRFNKSELTYFNFVYYPYRDEYGKIIGIIVVASEVTDLVLAKKRLIESEKQFRTLVMQSPVPMAIFRGADFVIEIANRVMLQTMWGRTEEEVFGKKLVEAFPELRQQKYLELLTDVMKSGTPHREAESLAYVQHQDGMKMFYLDYEYAPLYDGEGSDATGIMVTVTDVTEKVQARQAIMESAQRIRSMVESAPFPIGVYVGKEMIIELANQSILDVWGKGSDVIGKRYADVLPELKNSGIYQQLDSVFTTGTPYHAKNQRVDLVVDGILQPFYFNYSFTPLYDTQGNIYGVMNTAAELTDLIVARQKLEENQARLSIVIEATELGTFEWRIKTDEVIYSEQYYNIFGFEPGTHISHTMMLARIHPEDRYLRDRGMHDALKTGVMHYEVRLIFDDSTIHWTEVKGKVFYDTEGVPTHIIGTVRDTTPVRQHQQELEESEQKFRLLASSMPQLVWTTDADGIVNYYNQAFYDYTGLTEKELLGTGWMPVVHPDDRDENMRRWMHAVHTGEEFIFENRLLRHDGTYRWHLSRGTAQRDINGEIQMWVGTCTDIQEQKSFSRELEKQVQLRTRELEEKNRELENMNTELKSFAYVSSHDLQEPLRKIQTFSGRVMDKELNNLSDKGKDYLHRMHEAAGRMQTLIEDLLAYSRTSTSNRVLVKTDLGELVNEVKTEMKDALTEKVGTLEISPLCEAYVVPFQFRQLMQNLIGNSLKFSKPGRPPHISVSAKTVKGGEVDNSPLDKNKNYCHLTITDNGIGFDPQYKDRIFEVFQRLHTKDAYKGTGIGLAIVKKIVDNHNGYITASAKVNEGAQFDIYLPAE
jgi:PAS domain S-box-containing protein